MTREELRNELCTRLYGGTMEQERERIAYCNGWHDADEHPKSPWQDTKQNPPQARGEYLGRFVDNIGARWQYVCMCEYEPEERIWSIGCIITDAPHEWMEILD